MLSRGGGALTVSDKALDPSIMAVCPLRDKDVRKKAMNNYDKLDAEIMKEISAHRNTLSMMRGLVWEFARQATNNACSGYASDVVGRRLQHLRRLGMIRYEGRRWIINR